MILIIIIFIIYLCCNMNVQYNGLSEECPE